MIYYNKTSEWANNRRKDDTQYITAAEAVDLSDINPHILFNNDNSSNDDDQKKTLSFTPLL